MKCFAVKTVNDQCHPETGSDSIPYPQSISEFEIQSYIYENIRLKGIDIRGEVSSTLCKSRLDLVVFQDRVPVLVIEVKKALFGCRARHSQRKRLRHQSKKYRNLLVKLVVITGMDDAQRFVEAF